jgi:hypothetical protein
MPEFAKMSPSLRILQASRRTLLTLIRDNDAAQVDRVGRQILDGISDEARRYLRLIEGEISRPQPDAAFFGDNGGVASKAAVADLVRQSERQREMGAVKARRAA